MTGRVRYLPYVRRGLKQAAGADNTIDVTLTLRTDGAPIDVSTNLPLAGPGNVTGLNPAAIRRRVPAPGSADLRAGSLPFIEFYEPALPWLMSPEAPRAGQLMPFLGLVCLPAIETVRVEATTQPLPTLKATNIGGLLPDPAAFGLMAHAQTRPGSQASSPNKPPRQPLSKDAFSRILCPSQLAPKTRYFALLLPLYAAGVKAGLGEDPSGTSGFAWTPGQDTLTAPVYAHWTFTTGLGRGLEDLLRDLTPAPTKADQTLIPLSQASVDLVPALAGSRFQKRSLLTNRVGHPRRDRRLNSALLPQPPQGTRRLSLPAYGQAYVKDESLTRSRARWYRQLNTDPSYRVLAAVGAALVRKHQDELVKFAFDTAGDIDTANAIVARANAAQATATRLYRRIAQLSDEAVVRFAAPAAERLLANRGRSLTAAERDFVEAALLSPALRRRVASGGPAWGNNDTGAPGSLAEALRDVAAAVSLGDEVAGANPLGATYEQLAQMGAATHVSASDTEDVLRFLGQVIEQERDLPIQEDTDRDTAKRAYDDQERQDRRRPARPDGWQMDPDFAANAAAVRAALDPAQTIPRRVASRLSGAPNVDDKNLPRQVLWEPVWPKPILEAIFELDPGLLSPSLPGIQPDSVVALSLDPAALEAIMVGANHELMGELRWRNFPVQRAISPIRRAFPAPSETDTLNPDTDPIATWSPSSNLGDRWRNRVSFIAIVRSPIFRRFPDTLVYLAPAIWSSSSQRREISPNRPISLPLFMGNIGPDAVYFGFPEDAEVLLGTADPAAQDAGYFLVFEPPAGETGFGLNAPIEQPARSAREVESAGGWNALSWSDLAGDTITGGAFSREQIGALTWARDAAHMAAILLENPVRVAIHISDLASDSVRDSAVRT